MPGADAILATTAEMLDALGRVTADARCHHAAGILRGSPAGRRATDDAAALAMVESLIASGMAKSRRAACAFAAELYAPSHQVAAMRDRLQRKLRRK